MVVKYTSEIIREAALLSPTDPPRPNKTGLLLLDAMRVYCPEEWRRWTDSVRAAQESPGPVKRGASGGDPFVDCWYSLRTKLLSGELAAIGYLSSPHAEALDRGAWRAFGPRHTSDIAESIARHGDAVIRGILVRRPPRPRTKTTLLADCERWFKGRVALGVPPRSKHAMYQEFCAELGDELAFRQFLVIWARLAPEAWKTPGASPRAKRPAKPRQSKR